MNKPSTQSALIIMAHGSRKSAANEEFLQLMDSISAQSTQYTVVKGCFLELAEPNLDGAAKAAIAIDSGCDHIDVYPLFFNQGNHVVRDIPKQIAELQAQYPTVTVRKLDYFGRFDELASSVLAHIDGQAISTV